MTATPRPEGWSGLFSSAFRQSRNVMLLLDERRLLLDVNAACVQLLGRSRDSMLGRPVYQFVVGGPIVSPEEWAAALGEGEFTGEASLTCADDSAVSVQWAATVEVVTGHRLVLFVALSTSRWGRRFRREVSSESESVALTQRELEIARLVALGRSGPEIADELLIAHDTVRTHVRNAMTKLGARSRAQLVAKAIGDGHVLA